MEQIVYGDLSKLRAQTLVNMTVSGPQRDGHSSIGNLVVKY